MFSLGSVWLCGGGALNFIKYRMDPEKYYADREVKVDVDKAIAASDDKE